jgi:hypothetical protein
MKIYILVISVWASSGPFPEIIVLIKDDQGRPYPAKTVKIGEKGGAASYRMTEIKAGQWKTDTIDATKVSEVEIDIFRPDKNGEDQGSFSRNTQLEKVIELKLLPKEVSPTDFVFNSRAVGLGQCGPCQTSAVSAPIQYPYGFIQPPYPGYFEVPNGYPYSGMWGQPYQSQGCGPPSNAH